MHLMSDLTHIRFGRSCLIFEWIFNLIKLFHSMNALNITFKVKKEVQLRIGIVK